MHTDSKQSLVSRLAVSLRVAGVGLYFLSGVGFAGYFMIRQRLSDGNYSPSGVTHLWARGFCKVLGLRVVRQGSPLNSTALVVSNHVSWIDIAVYASSMNVHFLSKIEVRSWPLIGWLADVAGTLFIKRGDHGASRVINDLRDFMQDDKSILLFPEGTTTQGLSVRRFHSKLFAAAIEAGVPVQPMTILYECEGTLDYAAPFVGDDDMLSHLKRYVSQSGGVVHVIAHQPIQTHTTMSSAELSRTASEAVRSGHDRLIAGLSRPPGEPPMITRGKSGKFQ